MSNYDNTNSGVLFVNDKKTKASQPALRGFMNIEGVDYWASAWRKLNSETGQPYISIAFQEKEVENPETINAELFEDTERKSDKAPNFRGVIKKSEDEELPFIAWIRVNSRDGKNMISLKVDEQQQQVAGDKIDDGDIFFGMGVQQEPNVAEDDDFDMPF